MPPPTLDNSPTRTKASLKLSLAAAALLAVAAGGAAILYWQCRSPAVQTQFSPPVPGARTLDKRDFFAAVQSDNLAHASDMLTKNPALATVRRTDDGATPLHLVHSAAMSTLLLDHGADINARDWHSRATPLRWAANRLLMHDPKTSALIAALQSRGASEPDIYFAVAVGNIPRIASFLAADPSLLEKNSRDDDALFESCAPLQIAAYAGQCDSARFLLDHGANIHNRSGWGNTEALEKSAWAGNTDMCALLLARGANPNDPTHIFDHSPLNTAAMMGYPAIVKLLIDHGALSSPSLAAHVQKVMNHIHQDEDSPPPGSPADYHQVLSLLQTIPRAQMTAR